MCACVCAQTYAFSCSEGIFADCLSVLQAVSLSQQLDEERAHGKALSAKAAQLEKAVADLSAQEAASENELRAQCGAAEARAR